MNKSKTKIKEIVYTKKVTRRTIAKKYEFKNNNDAARWEGMEVSMLFMNDDYTGQYIFIKQGDDAVSIPIEFARVIAEVAAKFKDE